MWLSRVEHRAYEITYSDGDPEDIWFEDQETDTKSQLADQVIMGWSAKWGASTLWAHPTLC